MYRQSIRVPSGLNPVHTKRCGRGSCYGSKPFLEVRIRALVVGKRFTIDCFDHEGLLQLQHFCSWWRPSWSKRSTINLLATGSAQTHQLVGFLINTQVYYGKQIPILLIVHELERVEKKMNWRRKGQNTKIFRMLSMRCCVITVEEGWGLSGVLPVRSTRQFATFKLVLLFLLYSRIQTTTTIPT